MVIVYKDIVIMDFRLRALSNYTSNITEAYKVMNIIIRIPGICCLLFILLFLEK